MRRRWIELKVAANPCLVAQPQEHEQPKTTQGADVSAELQHSSGRRAYGLVARAPRAARIPESGET